MKLNPGGSRKQWHRGTSVEKVGERILSHKQRQSFVDHFSWYEVVRIFIDKVCSHAPRCAHDHVTDGLACLQRRPITCMTMVRARVGTDATHQAQL